MLTSAYSFGAKLIHHLALGSSSIAELSFELDKLLFTTENKESEKHIFISGLARSGTTILLQYFYETSNFRSLTYADMPFVLMPNLWKKINPKPYKPILKERAHNDGMMVGFGSPEALEEVFWRIFCGNDYIFNEQLRIHPVTDEVIRNFKKYVNLILSSKGKKSEIRYLSKNNNNVLRLETISSCFPQSQLIITFRDPLQQAISLLKQHHNFCQLQMKDRFSLQYMDWLGHFEFGLNQKPFWLNDDDSFQNIINYKKEDINFWLASWKNYYNYINQLLPKQSLLVCYETLCTNPTFVLNKLYTILDINVENSLKKPYELKADRGFQVDLQLLKYCNEIYAELNWKCNHQIGIPS